MLVIRTDGGSNVVMRQQTPTAPGILGEDELHGAQHLQRPKRDISEVADGGGDEIKGAGGVLVWCVQPWSSPRTLPLLD